MGTAPSSKKARQKTIHCPREQLKYETENIHSHVHHHSLAPSTLKDRLHHVPTLAGKGGFKRGLPCLPSIDSIMAVSSPQMYAPAPRVTYTSMSQPLRNKHTRSTNEMNREARCAQTQTKNLKDAIRIHETYACRSISPSLLKVRSLIVRPTPESIDHAKASAHLPAAFLPR